MKEKDNFVYTLNSCLNDFSQVSATGISSLCQCKSEGQACVTGLLGYSLEIVCFHHQDPI